MDTYKLADFFKHQQSIFDILDRTKQPIEITTTESNNEYVVMSKDIYQQLASSQAAQLRQADADIRHYALSHHPQTPANNAEMENWLNKD